MSESPAALADLIGAAFPAPDITVAKTWTDNDGIHWTPESVAVRTEEETDRLFYDFVMLANAPDDRIGAFAKRWGVLGLCQKHGIPMCHHGDNEKTAPATQDVAGLGRVCPPRRSGADYVETFDDWRKFAIIADRTMTLARQLRQGEPGDPETWQIVYGRQPTAEDRMGTLASCFTLWLLFADLRPIIGASPGGGALRLWVVEYNAVNPRKVMDERGRLYPICGWRGGLFGLLATHLLLTTSGGPRSWAHCSNPDCRNLFVMRRHIPEGRNRFCDDCTGGKVSRRLSKRRLRPRLHRLH